MGGGYEAGMAFKTEVFEEGSYAERAAEYIAGALPGGGGLVITGGGTAKQIFPHLAGKKPDWSGVAILFSDERVVPPDHEESNYGMAKRLFLDAAEPGSVHRVKGELEAEAAAADYEGQLQPFVGGGIEVAMLGMGADCHIGAMFPGSPGLDTNRLAIAVDRPDGMQGVTLTAPAMLSAKKILLVVSSDEKADAVARVVSSDDPPEEAPARVLADHPDVTFLLTEGAATKL